MTVSGVRRRLATLFAKIGTVLLRGGEMDAAAIAHRCAVRLDPGNISAHLALSALLYDKGRTEDARRTLVSGIRNNPFYVRHCPGEPTGHVLTVRGVQGGHYMIQRRHTKEFKITLRGGNISDRHLIDRDRFTVTNFFILDGNILDHAGIPRFDIVVNTISDPDLEPDALRTLRAFVDKHPGVPVINHPDRVLATARDENYRRFKDVAGLLFPATLRIKRGGRRGPGDAVRAMQASGLSFPILVREAGMHTGRTLRRFDDRDDLERDFAYDDAKDLYITRFVDCRFRGTYFRKMRVFFVDGRMFPVVCHFDTVWNVHGDNRTTVMAGNPWMMEEEQAFMADPEDYLGAAPYRVLEGLHDVVGLEFFGADFTVTDDGAVLIYEVNPVMIHKFDHARNFPYLVPYLESISEAFNRMITARLHGS